MILHLDDGSTIGFGNNSMANLADTHQRMVFALKAAARFDELLQDGNRFATVRSVR